MFGVGTKEDNSENGKSELKVGLHAKYGKLRAENSSPAYSNSSVELCPQRDRVNGNSKHETALNMVKYSRYEQI